MRVYVSLIAFAFVAACSAPENQTLTGYIEVDLLYLAPQDGGVVKTLSVREGDRVDAGEPVFALDSKRAAFAVAQADAAAESIASRIENNGALEQEIAEAQSALTLAQKTFDRSRTLVGDGAVSKEKFDMDAAAVDTARARLDRVRAERGAMTSDLKAATAPADLAEQQLLDLATRAPAAGSIERIYRRPGEVVAPGEPVVALLPPGNFKLKFFAPEPVLASMQIGEKVSFDCDACAAMQRTDSNAAMTATISFVASDPQFTPPLIYSLEEREKLVFLVEARPDAADALRPGLPVTVRLP